MSDERDLPIHASFLEAVASPQVKDLVADFAELTLDTIADDETLKAIPLVRTLVALKGVRERFQLKKLYRFFSTLGQVPQDEREAFIARMNADPKRARKVGETFAVWLDRLDDEEKAELLARVFEVYARGRIDFPCSTRLAAVIDRAHLPYLRQLKDGVGRPPFRNNDVTSHLLALGLLRITANQEDVEHQRRLDRPARDIELVKMEPNEDARILAEDILGPRRGAGIRP